MFRRTSAVQPAPNKTVPRRYTSRILDVNDLSDADLKAIVRLQADTEGNVKSERPLEYTWKNRHFHLTRIRFDIASKKWIMYLRDPATMEIKRVGRASKANGSSKLNDRALLREALLAKRRHLTM